MKYKTNVTTKNYLSNKILLPLTFMNLIFCLGNRAFKSDVVIVLDAAAAAAGGDDFTVEGRLLSTPMSSILDVLSSSTDETNNLVIVNGRVG